MEIEKLLAAEFNIRLDFVMNIINLIDEGNTIPFISRYRKEQTGSCDDQVLRLFNDRLTYLRNLKKRKEDVENSIREQEKWTEELEKALFAAKTLTEVEDIYRPFKQKRKTRASVAIKKGLQPLADVIFAQATTLDIETLAKDYITDEVENIEDAINGAKDIIAEMISDDAENRKELREVLQEKGMVKTLLKENEKAFTYEMYADYGESIKTMPAHRVLAINRGEKEDCLKVEVFIEEETALGIISKNFKRENSSTNDIMDSIIADSYKRLIFPSIEREIRNIIFENASEQAIKMFEVNLKPLLLAAPLKDKVIMGFDPAYRTGCKIAVIDGKGDVLTTLVVYPTPPQSKVEEAELKLTSVINKFKVDVISIGNGTASKESEIFVSNLIKKLDRKVCYTMVNEAGASVYSASKLGAEEFPDFDVSLRSAVSIARRLQDPLSELIKIDVKSIGVGQYQHDMPQNRLTTVLDGVVEDCVNSVGVDLNVASYTLLSFISGLSLQVSKNIVNHRSKIKKFTKREQLKDVAKLGPKAYEQCAGFLRISGGDDVFDCTSIHPESYAAAQKLLDYFEYTKQDILNGKLGDLTNKIKIAGNKKVAEYCGIGEITLNDIAVMLTKPNRDIRDSMPAPVLRADLLGLEDLKEGMIIDGVVRNVIDFGAFVDIGVHQDGLVHISEICDKYIKHPSEELKTNDNVKVKVLSVDVKKKRISLSIKQAK